MSWDRNTDHTST